MKAAEALKLSNENQESHEPYRKKIDERIAADARTGAFEVNLGPQEWPSNPVTAASLSRGLEQDGYRVNVKRSPGSLGRSIERIEISWG